MIGMPWTSSKTGWLERQDSILCWQLDFTPRRYLPTLHLTETRRAKSRHLPTCRISKLPSALESQTVLSWSNVKNSPIKGCCALESNASVFLAPNVAPKTNIQSNPHSGPIASSSNNWTRHDNTYHKLPLQSRPISHQPSLPAAQWHVFLAADVSGQWVPISRSGDSIFNLTCYWTKHFELEDLHCPRGTLEGLRLAKKSPRLSQDLHTLSGKCWDDLSVKTMGVWPQQPWIF